MFEMPLAFKCSRTIRERSWLTILAKDSDSGPKFPVSKSTSCLASGVCLRSRIAHIEDSNCWEIIAIIDSKKRYNRDSYRATLVEETCELRPAGTDATQIWTHSTLKPPSLFNDRFKPLLPVQKCTFRDRTRQADLRKAPQSILNRNFGIIKVGGVRENENRTKNALHSLSYPTHKNNIARLTLGLRP